MRIKSGFPLFTNLFCCVWFSRHLFFLLFIFPSLGVLEERMRECRHTTSGSVGRRGDTEDYTVIRGSQCGFPYDHASKVICWWYLL